MRPPDTLTKSNHTAKFTRWMLVLTAWIGTACLSLAQYPDWIVTAQADDTVYTCDFGLDATIDNPSSVDLSFSWTCVSSPSGTQYVNFNTSNSLTPTVSVSTPGEYTFRVEAIDNNSPGGTSVDDYVTITVDPPLVINEITEGAGVPNQSAATIQPSLYSSGNQVVWYTITQLGGPATATWSGDAYDPPTFGHSFEIDAPEEGYYYFRMTVSDGVRSDYTDFDVPFFYVY